MCLFVVAVVPKSAPLGALADVARKHDRDFVPSRSGSLVTGLRRDETHARTTRGHCDCGCSLFYSSKRDTRQLERDVKKLRAKQWSEAKIERWVTSTEPHVNTRDNDAWASFLDAVLAVPKVPYFGLLGHWFSKDETITVRGRAVRTTAALRDPQWEGLELDVVHVFTREAVHT